MKHEPSKYPLMLVADVIVGCSTESADRVYKSGADASARAGDHSYLAFFDSAGDHLGEVKVTEDDDGNVMLEDTY